MGSLVCVLVNYEVGPGLVSFEVKHSDDEVLPRYIIR